MTLYVREPIDYRGNSPRYAVREATERELLDELVRRFLDDCDECDGTGTGADGIRTCFLCNGLGKVGTGGTTLVTDTGEMYPNRGDLIVWSDRILPSLREETK